MKWMTHKKIEYVKGDRFSNDFIEKRRISLERFIERITRHPILRKAEFFIMFLESSEFVILLFSLLSQVDAY